MGLAMSALLPSAAIVKAARQTILASRGKDSNSFRAALIHETGRVLLVIGITFSSSMLSYLTTAVKRWSYFGPALTAILNGIRSRYSLVDRLGPAPPGYLPPWLSFLRVCARTPRVLDT